jgi:CelD/BcsL family acetyltransferase involved in cellulose biosynthesis
LGFSSSLIRSVDELDALEGEWESLAQRFASPLFDHDWFAAAAHALHDSTDLRIFAVRENGCLAGVAPLVIDRSRGRRLVLIGAAALYEPSGWLFASGRALEQLARVVAASGYCIALQRVPRAIDLGTAISSALRRRAVIVRRSHASSYCVDTTGSWDEYVKRLSSRTIRSLANLRERSEREYGSWDFSTRVAAVNDVDGLIETLIAVEGSGWKGRGGSALAHRPDLRAFFLAYARLAAARGRLRVATLRLGEAIAAVELGVEAYGRLWGLKIGYDERLSAVAPALQLTHASIHMAFERGLDSYEFLGVSEQWQERWKPSRREYELAMIYPFSFGGIAGATWDMLASFRKRVNDEAAKA